MHNKLSPFQGGFRKKRATVDNGLILDTVVKRQLEKRKGRLYLALCDFRKAFDFCSRKYYI